LATRSAGLGRPTLPPLSVGRNMRCAIFCVRGRAGVQLPPDRAPMPWGAPTGFSSDRRGRTYLFGARSRGRGLAKTTSLAQKRVPFTTRAQWRLAHQLCAGRKDKRTAHPSLPPPLECTEKAWGGTCGGSAGLTPRKICFRRFRAGQHYSKCGGVRNCPKGVRPPLTQKTKSPAVKQLGPESSARTVRGKWHEV